MSRWWPWVLVGAGLSGFVGALSHPQMDPGLVGPETASWIGDPLWGPSHALILLAAVALPFGLVGLARSGPLSTLGRRVAWAAAGVSVLFVVESVPHLLATTEAAAVAAGEATPFLDAHLVGAVIVYPLFGLAVATLALVSARRLTHPVVAGLGALGALAFGFAPIAVGPLGLDLGVLFSGSLLWTGWFLTAGSLALLRRRSVTLPPPAAPAAGT